MKAIVLCAGLGTRLRPLTFSTAKHLVPVANKPVLYYGIEYLRAVGVDDVGIIVSKDSYPLISAAAGDGSRWGAKVSYIDQPHPKGLAHAASCAKEFVGDQPFIMFLGDNLIPEGLKGLVGAFDKDASAVVMLKEVDDPSAFGIAVVEGDRIVRLVEKPKDPPSNLAIVGAYLFTKEIFTSIGRIKPSWRNEYEITDAIQDLIDRGLTVRPYIVHGWWKDTGKPQDILEANQVILDEIHGEQLGSVDAGSRLVGEVLIQKGAVVTNSQLRGPIIVGEGARLDGAKIGPYVSIGDRAQLHSCEVRNSVIMEDTVIRDVRRPLDGCLIGRNVEITGGSDVKLVVGDMCRVEV